MTAEAPVHPFPTLYERSKEGFGIYLGSSIWREASIDWVLSMRELMFGMVQLGIRGFDQPVTNDALITRSRSRAASSFLESQADILVMVDSDIKFLPGDLLKLAEKAYEYSIIGGAYTKRNGHNTELAIRVLPGSEIIFADDSNPVEVEYLSTGFLAVHRRVFEAMLTRDDMPLCHASDSLRFYPFFRDAVSVRPDGEVFYLSEDWAFQERAKEHGFKSWLDPSIRLSHLGSYDFNLEDMYRAKRADIGPFKFIKTEEGRVGFELQQNAENEFVTADGFKMFLDPDDSDISASIRRTGYWGREVRDAIQAHLKPNWTFLDLGAHIGYYSLLAASLGAQVIAVEPQPKYVELLKKSAKANDLEIKVWQGVVAEKSGKAWLHQVSDNTGESYTAKQGLEVEAFTLYEIGNRWPEMIKLDIEGDEYRVLRSCPALLENARVLIVEISDHQLKRNSGVDGEALKNLLTRAGFKLSLIKQHATYADWLAVKVDE